MTSYVFLKNPVLFLRNILQSRTIHVPPTPPTQFASKVPRNLIFSAHPIRSPVLAESGDFGFHFSPWSGMVDEKPLVDVLYLNQFLLFVLFISG